MRHTGRTTLLDRREQVNALSIRANIANTPQANFAFECAEDDLERMEAKVNQMTLDHHEKPANMPPIREKARK